MRIEVGAALQRNIRVIPILVDGAVMPDEQQLPEDLAPLVRRNAHDVSFAHFDADLDSFIRVLQRILAGPGGTPQAVPQPQPLEPDAKAPHTLATELPFTISLTTVGDVATPLIRKSARLPAEASEVFTTADDNQSSVEVNLCLGERALAKDNVPVGKFNLAGIPPAPRGAPQITIKAIVDPALILTVTAEDQASHQKQVLDAVDLTRIDIPPEILTDGAEAPKTQASTRDSPMDSSGDMGNLFKELFGQFFKREPDVTLEMTLNATEAAVGVERTIELVGGRQIRVKVPAGVQDGQRLRLGGLGAVQPGGKPGDLYILIRVTG